MGNILVAVILIALLIPAVKSSIKHFKGKGGCCGGSAGCGDCPSGSACTSGSCCACTTSTCSGKSNDITEINTQKKDSLRMTKTIKIEGMMCAHCEKHVKDALEKVSGVVSAAVSHENGSAVVTLSSPVDDALLKQAVEGADYTVTAIEQ